MAFIVEHILNNESLMSESTKMTFWITMTLKKHIIQSDHTQTSTRSYTNIVSPKISWSCFCTKEWNLFQLKEIMNMSVLCLADVLHELPCPICEFLLLKFQCCMESIRKSKESELYCIFFKICTLPSCSWIFYFQFYHKMWFWFWG